MGVACTVAINWMRQHYVLLDCLFYHIDETIVIWRAEKAHSRDWATVCRALSEEVVCLPPLEIVRDNAVATSHVGCTSHSSSSCEDTAMV